MTKLKCKSLLIFTLVGLLTVNQPVYSLATSQDLPKSQEDHAQDINQGIYGLDYDKNQVLASQGEEIESFIPRVGKLLGDKFIVVEREKRSIDSKPVDIAIIDSMVNRSYPGAIQLADRDFVNNQPNLLVAKRQPMNISIDLPGMKEDSTIRVENPNYANVKSAVDQLIEIWSKNYSQDYSLPARLQYSETMVHSKSQLESALNVNSDLLASKLGIDFNAIAQGEKKVMVAAYQQIFYNVSGEIPNDPADLFDPSVSFRDLERKGVSNERPPVLVSNVAYGRTIYVKLETESKSADVQAAFKALIDDNNLEASGKYQDVLDESSFTAVVLGGNSQEHNKIVTKDFDEILNIIKDNGEFSIKNPGYPLAYSSLFLKDNSVARVHKSTDYVETKSKEYTSGKINIDHYGAYVAQFEILWDELSYNDQGEEVLEAKAWEGNWKDRTARFTSVIYLPANAKNIRIYARECTGLAWEWWRTVIDERNLPLNKNINVYMGGTTLSPDGGVYQ